jgi:hypothetical protein
VQLFLSRQFALPARGLPFEQQALAHIKRFRNFASQKHWPVIALFEPAYNADMHDPSSDQQIIIVVN